MTGREEAVEVCADVVIAGIGLGAIAAALAVVRSGRTAVMAGPETRIGGQVTAQLTAPLDEHPHIEVAGCSSTYRAFRDGIRAEYGGTANPGGGWVSRLCFEPLAGERVLHAMIEPAVSSGALTVLSRAVPVSVDRDGDRITAVSFATPDGTVRLVGDVVIDATETGDLLPLAGADWVVGSEGRDAFGEPHALHGGPDPRAEQSCTIVAALVRDDAPGEVGPAPARYAELRDAQPFSLTLSNDEGHAQTFAFFDDSVAPGSFWSYRRVRDPRRVGGADAAIINWHGNDWYGSPLTAEPAATDAAARELAVAFVHWLRTEAPRDDGAGVGYPELRLAPEISGTPDGLAETPYVRESRRLASSSPVTEHDLTPAPGSARAVAFDDAVGIAWYHADLHPRVGGHPSVYAPTAPFQVPLRALVSGRDGAPVNLVAGAKNLAATQVAAAAFRVHHGEWAVGEAAGTLAGLAVARGASPGALVEDPRGRVAVQVGALRAGVPVVWSTDLAPDHPAFVAGSLLAAHGGLEAARHARLDLRPDEPIDRDALVALAAAASRVASMFDLEAPAPPERAGASWAEAARALAAPILAALDEAAGPPQSPQRDRLPIAPRTRMRTMHHIPSVLERLRGRLVVSCQARAGEPLHGPAHMTAMALSAIAGGAGGIRCEGPDDIGAIRLATDVPVIGLWKVGHDGVYITPTLEHALQVAEAGADLVAIDATARPRPDGRTVSETIAELTARGIAVMADVATLDEGIAAANAGAVVVGTTLSGYTPETAGSAGPDVALVAALADALDVPVFAEGRISTPAELAAAFDAGAWSVVVGGAITRPSTITAGFVAAIPADAGTRPAVRGDVHV